MKCLLGSLHFLHAQETLHYHFIREDDVHFQNLFEPNTLDKTCTLCCITFDSARNKKKHTFLFHYLQTGGKGGNPGMSDLPLNVLRRPLVTYYFNNFEQHKNFWFFQHRRGRHFFRCLSGLSPWQQEQNSGLCRNYQPTTRRNCAWKQKSLVDQRLSC